jgi:endonuclease YncB( thermonuclease family)
MKALPVFKILSGLAVLIASTALTSNPVRAAVTGQVVAVSSGDTLTVLNANNKQRVIKLAEIEAPEQGQPYYEKAKYALADKLLNKTISFERTAWDTKGQFVAKITLDGEYISACLR